MKNKMFKLLILFCFIYISCASLQESEIRSAFVSADLAISCNHNHDAIEPLSRILSIDKNNEKALRLRGECYFREKQYELALRDFTSLVEVSRTSKNLLLKAYAEYELDFYNDVIKTCNESMLISDDDVEKFNLWNLLANSYVETKDYSSADKYYSLMLQASQAPVIYCERSLNFIHMKEYQKAKDDMLKVLQIVKDYDSNQKKQYLNDDFYFYLGYCELALGNYRDALLAFEKVVDKGKFKEIDSYMNACKSGIPSLHI
ncbi:MAG: tetratricopeptide repeat protein [Treponema sp.]|nr:tetratricopeptide repeat protein [Treponema sp.]